MTSSTPTRTPPVFAFIARKGGVGKSTCTALISRIYAQNGLRVAVIDCDPQGTTTKTLMAEQDIEDDAIEAVGRRFAAGQSLVDCLVATNDENLSLVPSGEVLTLHANTLDSDKMGVVKVKRSIESLLEADVDIIMVDTPGNYGVFTFGALSAARWAIVPTFCQKPSAREVPKALDAIREAQALNPSLELLGIVANNLDARTKHELGVLETLRQALGGQLVEPPIPKATAITNAMEPGGDLDGENPGVAALLLVAEELLRRHALAVGRGAQEERRHAG